MVKLVYSIVVEGKYDQIKLSSLFDANIVITDGFGIFKDKEKLRYLKKLAAAEGLIVLTDSDAAGFKIRSYITGAVPQREGKLIHVYIPDVMGKERRKASPSAEGKIGVEGLEKETILEAFRKAGISLDGGDTAPAVKEPVTKTHLYEDGLIGGKGSVDRRRALLTLLDLPRRMSSNALLKALNLLMDRSQYREIVKRLEK